MFKKRLVDLVRDDIERVVADQIQESDTVEFKEGLSGRNGLDAWHTGADRIGERARNQLVEEIIAFANAHGGTLLVGIEESGDHPRRAVSIRPVPRCADVAARLHMFCRDLIDPPLPTIEIASVPFDGDAGVVAARVERSRNAPHRHAATLLCPVRRADRVESLTMREIQDLTLHVFRGMEEIDRSFELRSQKFQDELRNSTRLAMRATAIPISRLTTSSLYKPNSSAQVRRYRGKWPNNNSTEIFVPFSAGLWRPILRGVRARENTQHGFFKIEEIGRAHV